MSTCQSILILHIGAHKTATSTFQALASDRKVQTEAYYPDAGRWPVDASHNGLGMQLWGVGTASEYNSLLTSLKEEIAGYSRVLISSELFEKVPLRGDRDRLVDFLRTFSEAGFNINIVYTIRRQDCMIDAIFKQWVASADYYYHGSGLDLAEEEACDLDYRIATNSWRSFVENITIVPFVEGNVKATIDELFETLGVRVHPEAMLIPHMNPSIEGDALRFKHSLNPHRPPSELNDRINDTLRGLSDLALRRVSSIFSDKERHVYLNRFEDCNRDLIHLRKRSGALWDPTDVIQKELFLPATAQCCEVILKAVAQVNTDLAGEINRIIEVN